MSDERFEKLLGIVYLVLGVALLPLGVLMGLQGLTLLRRGEVQRAVLDLVWGPVVVLGCVVTVIMAVAVLRHRWRTLAHFFAFPLIVSVAVGPAVNAVSDLRVLIVVGVMIVVGLGALGLILRAIGELKGSARWKAAGYLVGALAYVVTASVSLTGAAHLLPSQ